MDIYKYYMRHTINGAPHSVLLNVLRGENPNLRAKESNGRLVLTPCNSKGEVELDKLFNSRIIKCVKEYYQRPDEPAPKINGSNAYLACDKVRSYLQLDSFVSRNCCRVCHICACDKASSGELEYK